MAQDTNIVVVAGRLTRDAESRNLQSGATVTDLRVAFTDREKRGDQWEDRSNYVDVTLWGHDGLLQYLTRGRQIVVTGRLRFEEWERDGEKRSTLKVVAAHVQLLQSPGAGTQQGPPPTSGGNGIPQQALPGTGARRTTDPDDIPF